MNAWFDPEVKPFAIAPAVEMAVNLYAELKFVAFTTNPELVTLLIVRIGVKPAGDAE